MKVPGKNALVAAAVGLTSQPCFAAAAESGGPVAAATALSAAQQVEFNLQHHVGSAAAQKYDSAAPQLASGSIVPASLSLASSQQTASEAQDQPKRRGPGATTWLIVGGVALLVVLAVVASASPTPGPHEGAF